MSFSKKLLSVLALCITGLSSPVFAEDDLKGIYATGYLGVSQSTDLDFGGATGTLGFDPGIEMQAGLGYDFGGFRIEGLYNRSGSDFEDTTKSSTYVDIISSTWVANVFMDFNNDSKFVTSLGVGIGGTKHEVASDEDTVLNTDFMVGVGYQITDNTILDIKYTYRIYDDITFGDVRISDESSQSILAGMKIYL